MIKTFDRKSTWDTKYVPNFRVVCLVGSRQLAVSDLTDRTRKVIVCNAYKTMPSDCINSSILDKQVFG